MPLRLSLWNHTSCSKSN